MKYLFTIICLFCSIALFAQKDLTTPYQEEMEETINATRLKFKQDSLKIVMRANEELKSLKEQLTEEIIKEKEQYARNVLALIPVSAKLQNVESFISSLMGAYDDPRSYLCSLADLKCIDSQLAAFDNDIFSKFNSFVDDLGVLEQSVSVLDRITPRDEVFDNLAAIKKVKFCKPEQVKCIEPVIASLTKYDSARKYVGYMLDAVHEAYDTYLKSKDTEKPTELISDELNSNTGVSTICSVPCFEKIYKRVIQDVLVYKKDKSFDFDKFNIRLLEDLQDKLE